MPSVRGGHGTEAVGPHAGHRGEVRAGRTAGHGDEVRIGAVLGAPRTNPTLQAPAQPIPVMIGMTALHLLEQPNRSQAGMGLKHRADLAVP